MGFQLLKDPWYFQQISKEGDYPNVNNLSHTLELHPTIKPPNQPTSTLANLQTHSNPTSTNRTSTN